MHILSGRGFKQGDEVVVEGVFQALFEHACTHGINHPDRFVYAMQNIEEIKALFGSSGYLYSDDIKTSKYIQLVLQEADLEICKLSEF